MNIDAILNTDGNQRYKDTYLRVKTKGVSRLLYCQQVADDGAVFFDEQQNSIVYHRGSDVDVSIVMPHACWKQFGRNTVLIQRVPARQWKRSLSRGTHSITPDVNIDRIDSKELDKAMELQWPSIRPQYLRVVEDLLNSENFSFTEGVKLLQKHASVALKGNYMLNKIGNFYVSNINIAKFNFKDNSYVVTPLFQEELRDITRGSSFKEVVKDALN